LRLALAAPATISALVLDGPPDLGAAPAASGDDEVPVERYRALMRTRGIGAVREEWARHPLARLRSRDPGMRALLDGMIARYPGHDLREAGGPAGAPFQATALESLGMPALVVTGEFDLATRQQAADTLARRLPAARRARIAAAGHLPNLDSPPAYDALLREFLARPAAVAH
jgi:pimeloyl-ACP methyl ester carboxylesterase